MMPRSLYREYLSRVFEERCQRNQKYSLRAFARDLGISPPRLSGVLSGKFGLSRDAAEKISMKLLMSVQERVWFCDAVESEHARSSRQRKIAGERLEVSGSRLQSLNDDQFKVISDWYHFAIMELTQTGEYRSRDAAGIAKRLGITATEVTQAVKRLLEYKLLVEKKNGVLELTGSFLANPEGIPSQAIRKHQLQLLQKAEVAVHEQSVEEREIRSLTVALSPDQVLELKGLLADFQKKVQSRTDADKGRKSEVYALSMQMFRLSTKEGSA